MKIYFSFLFIVLCLYSVRCQNNSSDPYLHLSSKELFKQRVLEKESLNDEYNRSKLAHEKATQLEYTGAVLSLGSGAYFMYRTSKLLPEKNITHEKVTLLYVSSLLIISGIVLSASGSRKKKDIIREFIEEYKATSIGKIETEIKLKTSGTGLALTYSF